MEFSIKNKWFYFWSNFRVISGDGVYWNTNYKQLILNHCKQFETQKPINRDVRNLWEIVHHFSVSTAWKMEPTLRLWFYTVGCEPWRKEGSPSGPQSHSNLNKTTDFLLKRFSGVQNRRQLFSVSFWAGGTREHAKLFSAASKCFPEQSCQHYVLSCWVSERGRFSNTWVFWSREKQKAC